MRTATTKEDDEDGEHKEEQKAASLDDCSSASFSRKMLSASGEGRAEIVKVPVDADFGCLKRQGARNDFYAKLERQPYARAVAFEAAVPALCAVDGEGAILGRFVDLLARWPGGSRRFLLGVTVRSLVAIGAHLLVTKWGRARNPFQTKGGVF